MDTGGWVLCADACGCQRVDGADEPLAKASLCDDGCDENSRGGQRVQVSCDVDRAFDDADVDEHDDQQTCDQCPWLGAESQDRQVDDLEREKRDGQYERELPLKSRRHRKGADEPERVRRQQCQPSEAKQDVRLPIHAKKTTESSIATAPTYVKRGKMAGTLAPTSPSHGSTGPMTAIVALCGQYRS